MIKRLYNICRRVTSGQQYIPEIDGLRFLALSMVVLFHLHGYFTHKSSIQFSEAEKYSGWINRTLLNGSRGVELFL
jgi:peptidoglycan/LPS O-acetylase OafA/YrhL